MAIGITSLGSMGDTTARSAHTCSITRAPVANTLVLASILATDAAGTAVEPETVAGAGLTFAIIGSSISYNSLGNPINNMSLWRATGSSTVSSVITATFNNATSGCAMLISEVTGATAGQSATSVAVGLSRLTMIAPVASYTSNAWFVVASSDSMEIGTVSNSYTTVDAVTYLTPDVHLISAWTTLSTGTIVGFGASGVDDRAGIILELVAPISTAGPQWGQSMGARALRTYPPRVRDNWVESGSAQNTDPATDTTEG